MKTSPMLTVLLSVLVAKLCCAYCITDEQQMPSGMQTKVRMIRTTEEKSSDPYKLPPPLLRRLHDGQGISYKALLRLSGKEEVNPQALSSSQKRDMHDFFVGLMGKRTTEPDNPTDMNKGTLPGFGDLKYLPNAE
ncbi:tachykinin-3 [Tiliqua scincoides]|uniref:tachykinin-3 n=1 Tax=Tiliqua scincoides TaxID=71010 RepID=UPI00346284D5